MTRLRVYVVINSEYRRHVRQTLIWSLCLRMPISNNLSTRSLQRRHFSPMFELAIGRLPNRSVPTILTNITIAFINTTQVATKMHKQFREDRYLYWSVISSVLQVRLSKYLDM